MFKICINLHSFTGTEYSWILGKPSYSQSWYARLPDIGDHSFKRITLFVLPPGSTKYLIKPMENWWFWCFMPDAHAAPHGCVCAATRGVCDRPRSEGIASVGSSNQLRGQPWDPRRLPLNQAKYRPKEQRRLDIDWRVRKYWSKNLIVAKQSEWNCFALPVKGRSLRKSTRRAKRAGGESVLRSL